MLCFLDSVISELNQIQKKEFANGTTKNDDSHFEHFAKHKDVMWFEQMLNQHGSRCQASLNLA